MTYGGQVESPVLPFTSGSGFLLSSSTYYDMASNIYQALRSGEGRLRCSKSSPGCEAGRATLSSSPTVPGGRGRTPTLCTRYGPAHIACHVIQRVLPPRFLRQTASYDE